LWNKVWFKLGKKYGPWDDGRNSVAGHVLKSCGNCSDYLSGAQFPAHFNVFPPISLFWNSWVAFSVPPTYVHTFWDPSVRHKNCNFTTLKPGVDVMITIFGDFSQFSAKKWRFFQKPMLWLKFCILLSLFWVKNANFFRNFFPRKYFKNHNIGPSCVLTFELWTLSKVRSLATCSTKQPKCTKIAQYWINTCKKVSQRIVNTIKTIEDFTK
jgi:hypothetical protein